MPNTVATPQRGYYSGHNDVQSTYHSGEAEVLTYGKQGRLSGGEKSLKASNGVQEQSENQQKKDKDVESQEDPENRQVLHKILKA